MIQRSERGPAVVGVDGGGSALEALDRAAAEAATRHHPLRVVPAFTWAATPFRTVAPAQSVARVVVGVDGSMLSTLAISNAFQATSQRGGNGPAQAGRATAAA